jgi:hypothetical protein
MALASRAERKQEKLQLTVDGVWAFRLEPWGKRTTLLRQPTDGFLEPSCGAPPAIWRGDLRHQ